MITVSVVVAVYNHEKYVKQAIDSILMQKTDFEIEVLIGEDCSTDNSRAILMEIEKTAPSNYHFFYREKNYGMEKNFFDLFRRTQGKYYIVLEGDDFWCYDGKLQEQVDFLESHGDYMGCSHLTRVVDENSVVVDEQYPHCTDEEYTLAHFRKGILPGQTACNMYRNYYKNNLIDYSLESVHFLAGDRRKAFYVASQGKIHCIQEYWSCYRHVTVGGSSFSANFRPNKASLDIIQNSYREMIHFADRIGNDEARLAAEELYYVLLLSRLKNEKDIHHALTFLKKFPFCKHKGTVLKTIMQAALKRS